MVVGKGIKNGIPSCASLRPISTKIGNPFLGECPQCASNQFSPTPISTKIGTRRLGMAVAIFS